MVEIIAGAGLADAAAQLPKDFSIVVSILFNLANIRHAQGDIYDFERIIGSSGALEKVLTSIQPAIRSSLERNAAE